MSAYERVAAGLVGIVVSVTLSPSTRLPLKLERGYAGSFGSMHRTVVSPTLPVEGQSSLVLQKRKEADIYGWPQDSAEVRKTLLRKTMTPAIFGAGCQSECCFCSK